MTFGLSAGAIGLIGAAATVGGAAIAANGAKKAANTQAGATADATAAQERMMDKQIALQEPFRQGGISAQNRLMYLMGLPPTSGGGSFSGGSTGGSGGGSIDRNAIRAELLPQFTKTTPGSNFIDYGQLEGSGQSAGGFSQPTTSVDEQALSAAIEQRAAAMQQSQQQEAAQSQQTQDAQGGVFSGTGSLNTPFGTAQYNADDAPKIGDFSTADFQADPGYAFRVSEGEKALNRRLGASGGLYSGAALKDAMRFNQGEASQEFGNAFNRFQVNRSNKLNDYGQAFNRFQTSRSNILNPLQSLMGAAQTATGQQSNAAANFGQQIGSNILGAGNARAAGQVGSANAINGAIGQGTSMYMQNHMLNRFFPQSGGGGGYGSWNNSPMSNLLYSNGSLGD